MKFSLIQHVAPALLILVCMAPLVVALSLEPDQRGHGTHEQMGWEPCSWLQQRGQPCPTCGMTTAFTNTVRLRFVSAFEANPAGLFLCLLCVAIPAYIIRSWLKGLQPARFFLGRWGRIWPGLIALVVFLGWLYKLATFEAAG